MMNERTNNTDIMPEKAYIAYQFDNEEPEVGRKFRCTRIQFDLKAKKYVEFPCCTSTVVEVGLLADDVYLVKTKHTYYIVKRCNVPEGKIKFAELYEVPRVGESMICKKLENKNGMLERVPWHTTMVFATEYVAGVLKIKTKNSTYFCPQPM